MSLPGKSLSCTNIFLLQQSKDYVIERSPRSGHVFIGLLLSVNLLLLLTDVLFSSCSKYYDTCRFIRSDRPPSDLDLFLSISWRKCQRMWLIECLLSSHRNFITSFTLLSSRFWGHKLFPPLHLLAEDFIRFHSFSSVFIGFEIEKPYN